MFLCKKIIYNARTNLINMLVSFKSNNKETNQHINLMFSLLILGFCLLGVGVKYSSIIEDFVNVPCKLPSEE